MAEKAKPETTKPRKPKWSAKRVRTLVTVLVYACLGLGVSAAWYVSQIAQTTPDIDQVLSRPTPRVASIYDWQGELIGQRGDPLAAPVEIANLPDHLLHAIVALHDSQFFDHGGVNWLAAMGAPARGHGDADAPDPAAPTITQQLASTVFAAPEPGLHRTIQTLIVASRLEERYTKSQVLEFYLNRVYFGAGAWGVEAAAQTYFGTSAADVNMAQSALLAALLHPPTGKVPSSPRQGADDRALHVLDLMLSHGKITPAEHRAAIATPVALRRSNRDELAGHFMDWVVEHAWANTGGYSGPIDIHTSLDLAMQRVAQDSLGAVMGTSRDDADDREAAMVAMNGDGAIRVMIGSRQYWRRQQNQAVDTSRPAGAALTPIVYAAALRAGLSPTTQRPAAPPRPQPDQDRSEPSAPAVYPGSPRETRITLTQALAASIDSVAANLAEEIGYDRVSQMASDLGLNAKYGDGAALAAGSKTTTLLTLTNVFTGFANGGYHVAPYAITAIHAQDGRVLYQTATPSPVRALSTSQAAAMNTMLAEALALAPDGNIGLLEHWSAGKAGTSPTGEDAWFIGYVPGFTAGVWVGAPPTTPQAPPQGTLQNAPAQTDGRGTTALPGRVWRRFMSGALKGVQTGSP